MTRKPILCVGALTADLMLQVPSLPQGAGKVMATRGAFVTAGMATSAATAAARLGCPVALWASAGDDALGDTLLADVAAEGIDTAHIRRVPGALSGVAGIIVDAKGERLVVPYYDPRLLETPTETPDFATFSAVLADVRWPQAAALALDGARRAGIPAILDLDVGPREDLADLSSRSTHIVASLAGAALLTGAQAAEAPVGALAQGCDAAIVVTDGEHGAFFRARGACETSRHPAFPVTAVDTNAAGDVFHGAFAVGLTEGLALADAIRLASAAAAIKCTRYGGRTGAPTRGEVEAFLDERREAA